MTVMRTTIPLIMIATALGGCSKGPGTVSPDAAEAIAPLAEAAPTTKLEAPEPDADDPEGEDGYDGSAMDPSVSASMDDDDEDEEDYDADVEDYDEDYDPEDGEEDYDDEDDE